MKMKDYIEFLKDKMAISHNTGFEVNPNEISTSLYPHVRDTVRWAGIRWLPCHILQFRYAENSNPIGDMQSYNQPVFW